MLHGAIAYLCLPRVEPPGSPTCELSSGGKNDADKTVVTSFETIAAVARANMGSKKSQVNGEYSCFFVVVVLANTALTAKRPWSRYDGMFPCKPWLRMHPHQIQGRALPYYSCSINCAVLKIQQLAFPAANS